MDNLFQDSMLVHFLLGRISTSILTASLITLIIEHGRRTRVTSLKS
jgi:hypothetical protein